MINNNNGPISHHFRDTAIYSLNDSIENCGQTATDRDMLTIDSLYELAIALSDGTIATSYDLPFSHNITGLAYHSVS